MINVERKRYIIVRNDNEILCGLARDFKFKPVDEIKNTAIKTYLSEKMAQASLEKSFGNIENCKVIAVTESIKENL